MDKNKQEIGFGGEALSQIDSIDEAGLDSRIAETEIIVPCDVHNYLLGKRELHTFLVLKKVLTLQ
ncbi:MAG: glycerate kinase [Saprospiraceae bacterium]|nr:glycerate kinase [Saprospiraceae bacterium]